MCGRFSLSTPADIIARFFNLVSMHKLKPRYNIAPTQDCPVVRFDVETQTRSLDMHHTIVPVTARPKVDVQALRDASLPLEAKADLRVLAPPDMVLHSATHLFNEGEFSHGLRDLADLDGLLRDFGADQAFWPILMERAELLDLRRPLFYALRYLSSHLATPIPARVLETVDAWGPGDLGAKAMDRLFVPALRPMHETCDTRWTGIARWLLYVRAHHLRMPAHILVPHLVRKAVTRRLELWKGRERTA